MHAAFAEVLRGIVAKKEAMDLYQRILKSFFSQTNERLIKIQKVQAEIDKNKIRVNKVMQLMLDGEIESIDYKPIKSKYETVNTTLLRERASLEIDKVDYSSTIHGCFNLLKHLDKFYNEASVSVKQKIVGLNFPEKLIYENGRIKNPKMNEVLSLIMLESNVLEHKKRDKEKTFFYLCPEVSLQGLLVRVHAAPPLVIPMNVGGFKSKDPVTNGYQDLIVSLRDRISNPLLQTLDALSALYQLIKGKFTLTFSPGTA